jgi:hypothetical protein
VNEHFFVLEAPTFESTVWGMDAGSCSSSAANEHQGEASQVVSQPSHCSQRVLSSWRTGITGAEGRTRLEVSSRLVLFVVGVVFHRHSLCSQFLLFSLCFGRKAQREKVEGSPYALEEESREREQRTL